MEKTKLVPNAKRIPLPKPDGCGEPAEHPKLVYEPDAPTIHEKISPDAYRHPKEGESPVLNLYFSHTTEPLPVDFPERVTINYTAHKCPEEISWFQQAMLHNDLHWTLLGSLSTLLTKGQEGIVNIVDVLTPVLIPGANFWCSIHGNWHIGTESGNNTNEELLSLNCGNYSYFQNKYFFIAICEMDEKDGIKQLLMYIHKKPIIHEPRAQQD